jgi:L-iditol 2-dehydrogenase
VKALVLERNGELAIRNVPDPEAQNDWVLVAVDAAGICGSDIPRAYDNGAYHYPLIMGHEFTGTIKDRGVDCKLRVGSRVAVIPLLPCGECEACRSLSYAQCSDYDYLGSRRDGAFAELVRVPAANLVPVPEHVTQAAGAMTEPCAVALHGVRKLAIQPGASAVVYGAGPIGNLAAQWLRVRGCASVTLVDVDDRKLEIARSMGFSVLNSRLEDPVERYVATNGGQGADFAVEACGLPSTFQQTLATAGRGAGVVFLGNISGTFSLEEKEFSAILRKELRIFGTWNSSFEPRGKDDWSVSLQAMGREIDVESLISHRVSLDDAPSIFDGVRRRVGFHNKVILLPGGAA